MNIVKVFESAFNQMKVKGWDKIYVLVDIHDTIFKASYHNETFEWVGNAKQVLQMMSQRDDIYLILWSGSWNEWLNRYNRKLIDNGIIFDEVCTNSEVQSSDLYCSENKIYFNVGIDDRFGFEPEDWDLIMEFLNNK